MKPTFSSKNPRRAQRGSAVVVTLAMLAIMMICVAVNTVAVRSLGRELKLLEKKQVKHWQNALPQKAGADKSPATLQAGNLKPHD